MEKVLAIITLTIGICNYCISQISTCNNAQIFCTGITYNFPAPVNNSNAEIGPDYGCLITQPNPTWYFLLIDYPGNISLDIHSVPQRDIDFICYGPFKNRTEPCTTELFCFSDSGSHHAEGPGGGYPVANTIDCSYSPSWQEWCYIPNAQTGEYYLLLITNSSNQPCNILLNQNNTGVGAGTTNCCICACAVAGFNYTLNSCDTISNEYSVSGNVTFLTWDLICGQYIITDQPSGISQTFEPDSDIVFSLNNIPSDGQQHTLTGTFTGSPSNIITYNYNAPNNCIPCISNAGTAITVCGLETNLNAIELNSDTNTHWLPQTGICFNSKNNPTSLATANSYGIYNLVWQITDSTNFTCTDSVSVEFIDPALCTSVLENKVVENFTIFPNPVVNSIFTINYSSKIFDKFSIKIINTQGVEVFRKFISKKTESIEIQIDSSGLINGYYLVEINDGQKIIRKPLVVQNIF